jgi:hypothetical protein
MHQSDATKELPGTRDWSAPWADFCTTYRDWLSQFESGDPVYIIPKTVLQELAVNRKGVGKQIRASKPLLNGDEVDAELAFLDLCQGYGGDSVGVWDGVPILYPLLDKADVRSVPEQLLTQMKWDQIAPLNSIQCNLENLAEKTEVVRRQQLAYAGFLTFDVSYRLAREQLMTRWRSLSVTLPWPMQANTHDQEAMPIVKRSGTGLALAPEIAVFLKDMGSFLRKHRLNSLVTWDLPLPQGPLDSIPLSLGRHLLGPEQIVNTYPSYYDIPSSMNVRAEIREQQRTAAKQTGVLAEHPLTNLSPRDGRASTLETAFRMWFVEAPVRSRYGDRKGVIARLDSALATTFGITAGRIRRVRQSYTPFLH